MCSLADLSVRLRGNPIAARRMSSAPSTLLLVGFVETSSPCVSETTVLRLPMTDDPRVDLDAEPQSVWKFVEGLIALITYYQNEASLLTLKVTQRDEQIAYLKAELSAVLERLVKVELLLKRSASVAEP